MKILLSLCISVLTAAVVISCLPVNGEEAIYSDTLRLHVIAKSDSEEDQKVKLVVRDAVMGVMEEAMRDAENAEEAYLAAESMTGEVRDAANDVLRELGCTDTAEVILGAERYPVREYDDFTLPAGVYNSLRVVIGEGEGANWWCILFPAVCVTEAVRAEKEYVEAGFTPEQYRLIENDSPGRYKVRFRVLEVLSGIFGFEY